MQRNLWGEPCHDLGGVSLFCSGLVWFLSPSSQILAPQTGITWLGVVHTLLLSPPITQGCTAAPWLAIAALSRDARSHSACRFSYDAQVGQPLAVITAFAALCVVACVICSWLLSQAETSDPNPSIGSHHRCILIASGRPAWLESNSSRTCLRPKQRCY
jgi:hypothetical protein